jgi:hypothetical protein
MGSEIDGSSKRILEDQIKNLVEKGYKKKDVKNKLLQEGYDNILVNKLIYPYRSVLIISGIILIVMILVIGAIAAFMVISNNADNVDGDSGNVVSDTGSISIPDVICRGFLEDPEKYVGSSNYDDLVEGCENYDSEEVFDCSVILEDYWRDKCEGEIKIMGFFRSEELWKQESENQEVDNEI